MEDRLLLTNGRFSMDWNLRATHILLFVAACLAAASFQQGRAQPSDNHIVTVNVDNIDALSLRSDYAIGPIDEIGTWVEGEGEGDNLTSAIDYVTNAEETNSRHIDVSVSGKDGEGYESFGLQVTPTGQFPGGSNKPFTGWLTLVEPSGSTSSGRLIESLYDSDDSVYIKYRAKIDASYDPTVETTITVKYTMTE